MFVTHQFFPEYYTGVERLTLNLVSQLRRMGHTCTVLAPESHAGRDRYSVEGLRVRTVVAPPADLARPWLHSRTISPRIRSVIHDERPDVVHVMHPMRLPQVFDEALRAGIPLVAHVADFYYPCARVIMVRRDGSRCPRPEHGVACEAVCRVPDARERVAWGQWALASAAAVVCPSRATIERHRESGFDTAGWEHIPWGTDYALRQSRLPPPTADVLSIGFLGTLLEHKGAAIAVEAMRLRPRAPIRLEIYGEAFHERRYDIALRRLAAEDARVRFHGAYGHESLVEILAELDAVAIPSLWHENLPTTGLNAVASGVPLLVSDVDGLTELVHDYECGWSFRAGDPSDLASLFDRIVAEPTLLASIRSRMTFPPSLEEEAWRMEALYERSVAAPRA